MQSVHLEILRAAAGAALVAALLMPASWAAEMKSDPRVPTPDELRQLPPYCPDTQIISKYYGRQQAPSNYDAHTKQFVSLYGSDFWHLHHYCFGLTKALRAERELRPSERRGRLEDSIGEYNYVIRSVRPDSILLPELHMQKGLSLIKLKRGDEGVLELQQSLALNPTYVRAYLVLSDYYADSGKKELALKVLEDGLTRVPDSTALMRRYASLGGTKTFAPPAASAEPASSPAPEQGSAAPEAEFNSDSRKAQSADTPAPDATNRSPYCRFCP